MLSFLLLRDFWLGLPLRVCRWVAWGVFCHGVVFHVFAQVVINEIHHTASVRTEPLEFVELVNAGTNQVDLGGWRFTGGIQFVFPPTRLPAGGYIVLAQDPDALRAKFGVTSLGPFESQGSSALQADGETITLRDVSGAKVDEVTYGLGFPWPTVGDPPGYSIELVNPTLDNDLGGNWRASTPTATFQSQETTLIPTTAVWRYFKGTREPSIPVEAWRQRTFDDRTWTIGTAPIGYGPTGEPIWTRLDDMRGGYTTLYLRNTFVIENPADVGALILDALFDDGFKVWINGINVLNANISAGDISFTGIAFDQRENNAYEQFTLSDVSSWLVPGVNTIAVQAANVNVSSSDDFFIDLRLRAVRRGVVGPTPGRQNSAYDTNAPPAVRQVAHHPEEPGSGSPVVITAKVTDPDGVASVLLEFQVVRPGSYIELTDSSYTNASNWIQLAMRDQGNQGDAVAGDAVFTAVVPGSVQVHRNLVRYRITVVDSKGAAVRVPYADDPQPNFAYFVYDGVPGWRGAARPGVTPALEFSSAVMSRLPTYHLISRNSSVVSSTWTSRYRGETYPWLGTLVYDGKVYDHIHYRARGWMWRYSMCKNMWKFDFNRGHDFHARDNWSREFRTPWTKLNLGAVIQQGDYDHRGEQGMFEAVGFRLFQLMGVPAPHTTFVTFRVIDDVAEADGTTQYEGDFWGLYLAVEQEDGRFLEEHGLADGNFYKMESGTGELNHLGRLGPQDKSDLNAFLTAQESGSEAWWRTNLNLPSYYSFQSVVQAIHHYDVAEGKNYFYHRDPMSGLWTVVPWDLDLTWADNMYRPGASGGDEPFKNRVLSGFAFPGAKPTLSTEFRNRVCEFRDLLWNGDEAYRLIDEYAVLLRGPGGGPTILDADRAMWDFNPKMASSVYSENPASKAGQGRYYQWPNEPSVDRDFNGCVQLMKDYVVHRATTAVLAPGISGLDGVAFDDARPTRPVLTYLGPAGFPVNRLLFRSSAFATSSRTNHFAAVCWRAAEITTTNSPDLEPVRPASYEIEAVWESTQTAPGWEVTVPPSVLKPGHRYRVRVRMIDDAGRASHWSPPEEFVGGESDQSSALVGNLRITEVMFNPPAGGFEFVELRNASGNMTLDLTGVKFTQGIDYVFGAGVSIAPGGYLVLTKAADLAAFRAYHGLAKDIMVVGPFSGSLSDGGERVVLRTSAGGTDIVSFSYGDGRGWIPAADGAGHSIVVLDDAVERQGAGSGNYPGNWRASTYARGSPGATDPAHDDPILLNEIAAHTDYLSPLDSNDWIELFNRSAAEFTFGPGWYLSDDPMALAKWMIPPGTVVPGRGFVTFDEIFGFHSSTNTGFGLSKSGEHVFLSCLQGSDQDRVVDAVAFKGQENDMSLGRYPDGSAWWMALTPRTPGAANVKPIPRVHISEFVYHPRMEGTNELSGIEFVELRNPTAQTVTFSNSNGPWRLTGGISLAFPSDCSLGPGSSMLAVSFSPTNQVELARFRSAYPAFPADIVLVGPWLGRLANESDRIALEMPQGPDLPGESISWVIVDEVIYADQFPWPAAAASGGVSLQRLVGASAGCDPANWVASAPSPGVDGLADSDGDGMPDAWERTHGLDPLQPGDASADPDDDGLSSLAEYGAGTDPLDPGSCLRLDWESPGDIGILLRFTAMAWKSYTVLSQDPEHGGAWIALRIVPAEGVKRKVEWVEAAPVSGARLYRLVTPAMR